MGVTKMTEERKACIEGELTKDPEIPSMTLARRLIANGSKLFSSVESARSCIRTIRGENGTKNRKGEKFKANKKRSIADIVPTSDSQPEQTKPVNLNLDGHGTIISDVHIPYHSQRAIQVALEHSEKSGAMDWLFINGDFIDFYTLSRWNKNPKSRRIEDELGMARDLLADLAKYYKKIIYKSGNHERRFETYLYMNAPELSGLPCLTLAAQMEATKHDIQMIGAQQIVHIGKYLTIAHGHELAGGNSPVNPARGAFMKAKDNVIVGHHHKPSEHVEANIRRKVTSAFSLGCLCELSPPYAPVNGYVHGFANMKVEGNDFEVFNHRITDNYKVR